MYLYAVLKLTQKNLNIPGHSSYAVLNAKNICLLGKCLACKFKPRYPFYK